ncbi:hypothetical protein [Cellulomonas soli]
MTQDGTSTAHGGWELSDAWILAAIGRGTRHDELNALLRAADYYNHAIPTEDEVRQGIGRLQATELIAVNGRRWQPTAAGTHLWTTSTGAGYTRVVSLLEALSSVPLREGTWDVPPGALDRAYRRYAHPFIWRLPQRKARSSTRGRH